MGNSTLDERKLSESARQFLTFRMGEELFGMDLDQTREILEYTQVTAVPLMPEFILGVINLRGEVVPVIDLALRLGRSAIKANRRSCIIIVELNDYEQEQMVGLLVDTVSEVTELEPSQIESAPSFGARIRAEFISGIAKENDNFVILLDAEKTLSPIELAMLVEAELTTKPFENDNPSGSPNDIPNDNRNDKDNETDALSSVKDEQSDVTQ